LGESFFTARELDESNRVCSAIVKESSDVAEAYYGLGRIEAARGNWASAMESLRKACELFPNYGAAHYTLAQVDGKLGKSEESQEQLRLFAENKTIVPPVDDPLRDKLRRLDMGAPSRLERGFQLEQVGRVEDAIAETEKASQLDPTLVRAHINLIILQGKISEVVADC
jgi:tetratricopeptide (TPR) repeat protein